MEEQLGAFLLGLVESIRKSVAAVAYHMFNYQLYIIRAAKMW